MHRYITRACVAVVAGLALSALGVTGASASGAAPPARQAARAAPARTSLSVASPGAQLWAKRAATRAAAAAPPGDLTAVSAASPTEAWAVGCKTPADVACSSNGKAFADHWDGKTWTAFPVPMPPFVTGAVGQLNGVKDVSPTDAWAVGYAGTPGVALLEHWDGTAWNRLGAPSLGSLTGTNYALNGISGTSATDLWAVGAAAGQGVILHYNGTKWARVPSPSDGDTYLQGVVATSATNAWAVGENASGLLVQHWNGKSWTTAYNALAATGLEGSAVAASSSTNAWAVGWSHFTSNYTVTLRWNGKTWTRVTTGLGITNPNGFISLFGVATTSPANVWAVGAVRPMLHWNGSTWKSQAVPAEPSGSVTTLSGLAATTATNAWAVGHVDSAGDTMLLLHYDTTGWHKVTP